MPAWVYVQMGPESMGPPGARATCACELCGMGAGSQAWVLCKTMHPQPLSRISSPLFFSLIHYRTQSWDMALFTFRLGLSLSMNTVKTIPHRCAVHRSTWSRQSFIETLWWVIPLCVKVTARTNHHQSLVTLSFSQEFHQRLNCPLTGAYPAPW